MVIEDDVWFVGHCIVSPILACKKSMAMVGSVITKNMEENHIYGGCPAIDLTDRIGNQFIERTIEEKLHLMNEKINEFFEIDPDINKEQFIVVSDFPRQMKENSTYFSVRNRTYTKRRSTEEIKLMNFLLPLYKFTPYK